jgi:gas vesicle protein
MITFKKKEFSSQIVDDALTGAMIGASVGGVLTKKAAPKFIPGCDWYNSKVKPASVKNETVFDKNGKPCGSKPVPVGEQTSELQQAVFFGATTLIGAALGALCGAVKELNKCISGSTANDRLMRDVVKELEKKSYQEGKDFTRDPKQANIMKTKVCIVLSKNGGEFKALINTVNDKNLKKITDNVLRKLRTNLPETKNNSASNRYNEISISTIPNAKNNVKTVVTIASEFIQAGYATYLVEVG